MKIIYLSTSRLPTEKAYGVTVLESAKAARSLGIEFDVFSPGSKSDQEVEQIVFIPSISFPRLMRNRAVRGIRMALFRFNSALIPLAAIRNNKFRQAEFIWLRDPISALILTFISAQKGILLEMHHRPVGLGVWLIRKLSTKNNVTFAALSPKLVAQIEEDVPGIKIFEAPMGVPKSFFSTGKPVFENPIIRFLYMGKGESSGFDNGLEVFVKDFARAHEMYPQISLTFLGLETKYKEEISKQLVKLGTVGEKVEFVDHIPHNQVPKILGSHDVGVLPYPETTYNSERFPLKSLEYAASELVIIASDIDCHVNLIGRRNAYFYTPGEVNSFEYQVVELAKNPTLRVQKIASAKSWADQFTYEKRIQGVVTNWLGESL